MAELMLEEQRENWGSRAGFVLAAVGSAVGLGNLWGFPYKLYKYGGGAFLIPYVIAMLLIGIPVLILEFSLGHMTQRAAPDAFRRAGRRKEMVGWWGILLAFVIITYYPVILAWCLSFLGRCVEGIIYFDGKLPWASTVKSATSFFVHDYCNTWGQGETKVPWLLGSINPEIAFCLAAVWMLMFLCIFRGVKVVSKVVMWTVPLPWLMLLVLMINGLSLKGSTIGLAYYLNPDWDQLLQPTTWRFAFGQVFFSMSLAFGVMITYSSFLHRKSDLNNNAMIVGLGDLGTSFVAGIVVFATLGAMSLSADVAVPQVVGERGTVGMAFMAFPYALAQLPGSAYFGLVFFFALIMLGIDSAFSITESVLASIVDKTGWNRTAVLWGMSFIGLAAGLVYCSRSGLAWLENIDGFINGPWGIALLGLVECLVIGWMFRISRLREHANERSDWRLGAWWDWNIRVLVPIVLSALFTWSFYDTVTRKGGYLIGRDGIVNVPVLVGLILAGLAPLLAVVLSTIRSRTAGPDTQQAPSDCPQRHSPGAREIAGAVLAVAALMAAAAGIAMTIRGKLAVNDGAALSEAVLYVRKSIPLASVLLAAAGLAGATALVLGAVSVVSSERRSLTPSAVGRIAGGAGAVSVGLAGGATMALYSLLGEIIDTPTKHTTEMTTTAWCIMTAMLAVIVFGLGWCFYRAIKAAGGVSPPEQRPEGIEA